MIPIDFEGSNLKMTAPAGVDNCFDLMVHKGHDQEGQPAIISFWKFSKEDLEDIKETGGIWLNVSSNSMPPVSLFTENPFKPTEL